MGVGSSVEEEGLDSVFLVEVDFAGENVAGEGSSRFELSSGVAMF
jgi:hypothetical protein